MMHDDDVDVAGPAPSGRHAVSGRRSGQHLPASLGQEQTWFLQQLVPDSTFHSLWLKARLRGPLDVDALRASVRLVHERHQALRSVVRFRDGALVQEVVAREPDFSFHDLATAQPPARSARRREVEGAELRRGFDLENGPLARFHLVRLDTHSHELLAVMHRLVVDEESCAVIQRELLGCYEAFAAGGPPALPELAFQFPDHARWQRELLAGEAGRPQLAYWTRALADLPDALALPSMNARGPRPSLEAGAARFSVPRHLWERVRRLAEEEAITPFVAAQAALAVLLHRHTGRRDLMLGRPSSGRRLPGASEVVGPFADLLPLRVRLPADPTWRDALGAVREAHAQAAAHPDVPFRRLCELVRHDRHLNMLPLTQVGIAEEPHLEPRTVRGVTFSFERRDGATTLYDLELRLEETPLDVRGALTYKRELFEVDVAETMARRFVALLEQMVSAPDRHFSSLSLLSDEERERVVHEWNQTRTDYPRDRTVHALFEEWADRAPEAPALCWEDVELSYGQLERRANQLSHYLRRLGVGLETRVGLFFGYTADWVIAALATLKASGAYVPLDPAYPSDRLTMMCEDSGVQVLLVQEGLEGRLEVAGAHRLALSTEAAAIAREPVTRLPSHAGPEALAYVMFTSGSTGRPKAIAVNHRNVVRTVRETNYVAFGPSDTVSQASNISFDASTLEVWGALLGGSRLVGLRKEDVLQPQRLHEQLLANDIDIFFIPSALMKQLVSESPGIFSTLKYFLSGGEQADYHTLRRILDHGAPGHLINPYGPTETTVFAVTYECNGMTEADRHVPIGYPIGNTQCYVLDRYLQPVPPGVVGELLVGGDGVARGYLGRPDLTADTFIPDPFSDHPGARLYRTGDLGLHRPDGVLDFLGRVDRQVKIRGFRIEPGEVESCLLESERVREVSVQVDRDRAGDQILIAYVVPADPGVDLDELREHVRARVPGYMLPALFVPLPALPLNANGKLDARALRRALPSARTEDAIVEPRTATEGRIDAIWRDVLVGADAFGVHDDFFALGGTSLDAATIAARARATFRRDLPLRLVFEHPTVAGLAEAIDRLRAPSPGTPAPAPAPAAPAPAPPAPAPAPAAPAPAPPAPAPVTAAAGARTDTEGRVLVIWREILDLDELTLHDNFFAVGGHSLNAVRAVSRAKAVFDREIPLRLLFQNPTAAAFASAIDRLAVDLDVDDGAELRTVPAEGQGPRTVEHLLESVEELSDEEVRRLLDSSP